MSRVRPLIDRIQALRPTIASWATWLLVFYAIVAGYISSPVLNLALALGTVCLAAGLALALDALKRRSGRSHLHLPMLVGREELRRRELGLAERGEEDFWWYGQDAGWEEGTFLFWRSSSGIAGSDLTYNILPGDLRSLVDHDAPTPRQGHRRKAALVEATGLLSDQRPTLECRPVDWELTAWVRFNHEEFLHRNKTVSAFGLRNATPYPGPLCLHAVMVTSDRWLVLSLRRPALPHEDQAYHPLSWSASFEEQIELLDDKGAPADRSVADTARRGVMEEFGDVAAAGLEEVQVIGIGVECTRDPDDVTIGGTIFAAIQLGISLKELWRAISLPGGARDKAEHVAWSALRFNDIGDVKRLLIPSGVRRQDAFSPLRLQQSRQHSVPVSIYPQPTIELNSTGYPWHPTSRTRFMLWAGFAGSSGLISVV